jgi:hypothetical protein
MTLQLVDAKRGLLAEPLPPPDADHRSALSSNAYYHVAKMGYDPTQLPRHRKESEAQAPTPSVSTDAERRQRLQVYARNREHVAEVKAGERETPLQLSAAPIDQVTRPLPMSLNGNASLREQAQAQAIIPKSVPLPTVRRLNTRDVMTHHGANPATVAQSSKILPRNTALPKPTQREKAAQAASGYHSVALQNLQRATHRLRPQPRAVSHAGAVIAQTQANCRPRVATKLKPAAALPVPTGFGTTQKVLRGAGQTRTSADVRVAVAAMPNRTRGVGTSRSSHHRAKPASTMNWVAAGGITAHTSEQLQAQVRTGVDSQVNIAPTAVGNKNTFGLIPASRLRSSASTTVVGGGAVPERGAIVKGSVQLRPSSALRWESGASTGPLREQRPAMPGPKRKDATPSRF